MRLRWEDDPRDDRWVPLHLLLAEVYNRYRRPLFIGETSHFGVGRGPWLREVVDEVKRAISNGIPMEGITIYPIIDRPDWDDVDQWHNSGLWDLVPDDQGNLQRVLQRGVCSGLCANPGRGSDPNPLVKFYGRKVPVGVLPHQKNNPGP